MAFACKLSLEKLTLGVAAEIQMIQWHLLHLVTRISRQYYHTDPSILYEYVLAIPHEHDMSIRSQIHNGSVNLCQTGFGIEGCLICKTKQEPQRLTSINTCFTIFFPALSTCLGKASLLVTCNLTRHDAQIRRVSRLNQIVRIVEWIVHIRPSLDRRDLFGDLAGLL